MQQLSVSAAESAPRYWQCPHCPVRLVFPEWYDGLKIMDEIDAHARFHEEPQKSTRFTLVCMSCPSQQDLLVDHAIDLYHKMNELGWTLIPTQHGRFVRGICPNCAALSLPKRDDTQRRIHE